MNLQSLISIIIPVHNGSTWIDQCFNGILEQQLAPDTQIEICVCNDASNDNTVDLLKNWNILLQNKIPLKIYNNESGKPKGVGYSKNRAVSISSGAYLCFQDIDDIMLPVRILEQYKQAKILPNNTIVGCQFKRAPENSTKRYTCWANSLSEEKLQTQIYTSHGPTIIMPTWFCHRTVFEKVGGFSEEGAGTPEDLIFFYKHLDLEGKICRINQCLLIYTYHPNATTFSIEESIIWQIRLDRLQRIILNKWEKFTIWNAGKQGRKFYNSLSEEHQKKVLALCDVDEKKIGKKYISFNPETRHNGRPLDIIHFRKAVPPFVICVKIDLTNGEFEKNLLSLQLIENVDYVLFS
ncbi:hypothetical protein MTP99_008125 [Tenebrio molitor]|jgi:glycosyltransferase involved in cell wall biosynthesis|nr:hypothetical protein MTP99_008125 [Tenebrio molitor]